ncbi:MAG: peroxiredoxin [Bacteroidota bacterium]
MKTIIRTLFIFFATVSSLYSQEIVQTRIPLIGETAPSFIAESTKGKINFPADYFAKWKIIFSHPASFTPVCSTEIMELAMLQDEFVKLNTQLLVLSTDGVNSHIEWAKSLEKLSYKGKTIPKINFPLISDAGLDISKKYGMIHPNVSNTKDVRGVFVINPDNIICAMFFYPFTTGRNIDEIKRTLIALQENDKKSTLTPANWKPGDDVLMPSPKTKEEADKLKNDKKFYFLDWYIMFKRSKAEE